MVGEEFAGTGKAHGIDAVGLEGVDGDVAGEADNHEGEEELVAAGELGDEEYAGEGGVEYARHDAGHAEEGEVGEGRGDAEGCPHVPERGEDEAADAAEEEAGGEGAAATAAAVGGRGGEDLDDENEGEIGEEK